MKNNTRDRLIDLIRQSHCVEVWDYYNDDFKEPDPVEELADHIIKNDVVPVVRCKDCKRCYEKRTKRGNQLMRFCMRMDGNEYQVNANDFCSYGTPKERGVYNG